MHAKGEGCKGGHRSKRNKESYHWGGGDSLRFVSLHRRGGPLGARLLLAGLKGAVLLGHHVRLALRVHDPDGTGGGTIKTQLHTDEVSISRTTRCTS